MSDHPTPSWLVDEPYDDTDLGVLLTGKEAQVHLIERTDPAGRSCLLAEKRYLPRKVGAKGELEALGMQRASTFRNDVEYREGRQFRKSRDRRAVERLTTYGKRLLQSRWTHHEHDVMQVLWAAGVPVPYPVSFGDDRFKMQYVGDREAAAPQLARARLDPTRLARAADQLQEGLRALAATGWAHGDLSAYNLLWWDETLWFIDFPQAVDVAANPHGLDFFHRDVTTISRWFTGRGHPIDGEELFADALCYLSW